MQKATEEHSKWNIGFNAVVRKKILNSQTIFSVTFKRQGLNSSRAMSGREMALDPKVKDELVKHIFYL
jgi:hypothetical protein